MVDQIERIREEVGEEQFQSSRNGWVRGGRVEPGFTNVGENCMLWSGPGNILKAKWGAISYWEKETRRQKLEASKTYDDKRQKMEAKLMSCNYLRSQALFSVGLGTPFKSESLCKHWLNATLCCPVLPCNRDGEGIRPFLASRNKLRTWFHTWCLLGAFLDMPARAFIQVCLINYSFTAFSCLLAADLTPRGLLFHRLYKRRLTFLAVK